MTRFGDQVNGPTPGPLDEDRFATWDAAYVLGALSGAERREYEAHLEGCARCRAAVCDIGGMPGLLSRLGPDDVRDLGTVGAAAAEPPLRPEVRRTVLERVRRRRRRSRLVTSATVAAVAVAAAVLAVGVVLLVNPDDRAPATAAPSTTMTKLVDTPFAASVALSQFGWGTRVDMACSYGSWSGGEAPPPGNLGMVVVGRDGSRTQIATWLGLSGATALPSGNTPMAVDDIAAVQLVSADTGQVLLEHRQ